jgi:hypothetical protein
MSRKVQQPDGSLHVNCEGIQYPVKYLGYLWQDDRLRYVAEFPGRYAIDPSNWDFEDSPVPKKYRLRRGERLIRIEDLENVSRLSKYLFRL